MIPSLIIAATIASPNPYPTLPPQAELRAPAFAPNGTYEYGIYRSGKRIGSTKVVILRRDADNRIDIFESGSFGKVAVRVYGGLGYRDLLPSPWNVTYAGIPLPGAGMWRQKFGPVAQYTVRYELDQDGSFDEVDGVRGGDTWPLWSFSSRNRHVKYYTVFDPPFMAGVMTIPSSLACRKESYVFTLSEASPQNVTQEPVSYTDGRSGSRIISSRNLKLEYDPRTMIVREAWFAGMHDILESRSPSTAAAISFGAP